jgi:hypothetical protein
MGDCCNWVQGDGTMLVLLIGTRSSVIYLTFGLGWWR